MREKATTNLLKLLDLTKMGPFIKRGSILNEISGNHMRRRTKDIHFFILKYDSDKYRNIDFLKLS
jgi:hypothetical protein